MLSLAERYKLRTSAPKPAPTKKPDQADVAALNRTISALAGVGQQIRRAVPSRASGPVATGTPQPTQLESLPPGTEPNVNYPTAQDFRPLNLLPPSAVEAAQLPSASRARALGAGLDFLPATRTTLAYLDTRAGQEVGEASQLGRIPYVGDPLQGALAEMARPSSILAMLAPPLRGGSLAAVAAKNAALQGGLNVGQDLFLGRTDPSNLALSGGLGAVLGGITAPGVASGLGRGALDVYGEIATTPAVRRVGQMVGDESGMVRPGFFTEKIADARESADILGQTLRGRSIDPETRAQVRLDRDVAMAKADLWEEMDRSFGLPDAPGAHEAEIPTWINGELRALQDELTRREIPFGGRAGMSPAAVRKARRAGRTGRITNAYPGLTAKQLDARLRAVTEIRDEIGAGLGAPDTLAAPTVRAAPEAPPARTIRGTAIIDGEEVPGTWTQQPGAVPKAMGPQGQFVPDDPAIPPRVTGERAIRQEGDRAPGDLSSRPRSDVRAGEGVTPASADTAPALASDDLVPATEAPPPPDVAVGQTAAEPPRMGTPDDLGIGPRRVTFGPERQEVVQGIDFERAAPKPPRIGGADQPGIRLARDVEQRIETFEARARELGAPEPIARAVATAYRDGEVFAQTARQYSDSNPVQVLISKGTALLEGNVPNGVVNSVARAHLVAENAIRLHIDDTLQQFKNIDQYIAKAQGTATFIGPPKMKPYVDRHFGAAVVTHPEWFRGLPVELKTMLPNLQKFQNDMYKVVQAIDPNAAPALDAPYLRTLWEVPQSELASAVTMPIGRASVTKARAFPDPFEAMADNKWPYELKDVPVSQLVESSAHLAARQIGVQLERKMILQRFGTTTRRPGLVRFRNPNYAGWYAKPEIVNFIDQLHEPGGSITRAAGTVTNPIRNTVFGIGDIGVFGQQVMQTLSTRGPVALAAAINRGLERIGLGLDLYRYADDDLPRGLQRSLDGLPQGSAGRIGDQGADTLVGLIPIVGKRAEGAIDALNNAQFGGVLTPLRNMAYEGNLIVSKLLGRDIADPAVRRAAAENAAAFSGTSLGSVRRARRETEAAFLGAPGITRAMGAQLLQVAKLNTPEAWTTLASTGAVVYGLGSLLNMTLGSGEPVPLDPRKVDWASVRLGGEWKEVGGERVYVGGRTIRLIPQASLVRAIGKSMTAVEEGNPKSFVKAWNQIAFTRTTPAIQGAVGLATMTGFNDKGSFRVGDLDPKQALLNAAPLPILGQSAIEGDISSPDAAALNIFGVSNFPGESAEDIKEEQQKDVRKAEAGRLESAKAEAFKSQGWRDAFVRELGPEAQQADSIEELKQRYIDYWLPQYANEGPEVEVKQWLGQQFDATPIVRQFDAEYQQYRLQYWREHPDELLDAAVKGLDLTAGELELWQQFSQQGAAP